MGILGDLLGSNSKQKQVSNAVSSNSSYSQGSSQSENASNSVASSLGTSQSNNKDYSGNYFSGEVYKQQRDIANSGIGANAQLMALLGLGGDGEQAAAQANFRNTPGYQFLQDEGARAVNSSYAGQRLLKSGAAMKALQDRAMGIADTTYGSYMDRLLGTIGQSQAASGLIGDSGKYTEGTGSSTSNQASNSVSSSTGSSLSQNTASSQGYSSSVSKGSGKSGSGLLGQILSL